MTAVNGGGEDVKISSKTVRENEIFTLTFVSI